MNNVRPIEKISYPESADNLLIEYMETRGLIKRSKAIKEIVEWSINTKSSKFVYGNMLLSKGLPEKSYKKSTVRFSKDTSSAINKHAINNNKTGNVLLWIAASDLLCHGLQMFYGNKDAYFMGLSFYTYTEISCIIDI